MKATQLQAEKWIGGLLIAYVISLATTMSGMELFSSLLVVATFFFGFALKREWLLREVPPLAMPLLIFVIIAAYSTTASDASWQDKVSDLRRLRFFFFYFLFFIALRFEKRPSRLLEVLFVVAVLAGIYGFFQHFVAFDLIRPEGKKVLMYAIPEEKVGPLVVGLFNHHLTFASIFLTYACVFFSLGMWKSKQGPWFLALGLLLFLLCAWTQSRTAWIAIPVCILAVAWAKSRRWVFMSFAALLAGFLALYHFDPGFHARFDRTFFKNDDFYNGGPRFRLWRAQIEMIKDHPLVGMGLNNNERHAKEYVDRLYPERTDNFYGHAHSTPLQILATTGILGFGAYLAIWITLFLRLIGFIRAFSREDWRHWFAVGLFAAFLGFHIQSLTQWNFGDAEVLHNLIFFWAIALSLSFGNWQAPPFSAAFKK